MSRQRGVVIPIVTIGLLALLAVAGLALDGSHALANKTRMQNTADAAALAAAKVLDQTQDTGQATAAANGLFSLNADGLGNHELNDAYDAGDITVTVQYSTTVSPFVPGSPDGPFVRVIATGFDTQTTLSRVLNFTEISTPATAVAGPSGPLGTGQGAQVCDIAPIAVCADDIPTPPVPPPADDSLDPLRVLKPNPGQHGDIGPGNYKMLRLGCTGGACLRQNMAGDYDDCATVGEYVETEPGVSSTGQDPELFADCVEPHPNIYRPNQGPSSGNCNSTFEPNDIVTTAGQLDYSYSDYAAATASIDESAMPPDSAKNRRLLVFPVITCSGDESGQSTIHVEGFACFFMLQPVDTGQSTIHVEGFACFFMLQPVDTGHQGMGGGQIFGQYVTACDVNGTGGINPGGGPSPLLYKIQLYKDPDSGDS
jgi:Flp pilus assembly protein TadG